MTTQTDLTAVTTAAENIYRQSGPAANQIGAAIAALKETPPDVATALSQAENSVTNVSYLAFQSADLLTAAQSLATDINPTPPPPTPLTLTAVPNQSATVGTAITAITLTASGGTAPYVFTTSGLPGGLSLSGAKISGTPSTAGTSTVTVTVTDAESPAQKTTETFSITVAAATPPPPPPSGKILLGSYSTGQGQWSGTTAFANETGCKVSIRTDYAARTQATFINDLTYVLGLDAGMPFNLALGVPIVDDGYPPVWANYTQWIPLHKQAIPLIKAKFPNAIIRLGVELNIGTTTDFVPNPSGFVTAFNAIAPLYRAAGFKVEFNTVCQTGYNVLGLAQQCVANYDIQSVDPYDQSYATPLPNNQPTNSQTVWQSLVGGADGLNALATFARANGKGMAFAEWGVGAKSGGYGLGDDPTYIANIAAFITANADLFAKGYVSYFDNNPSGWDTRLSSSPNALAEFKKVFPAIVG